MWLLFGMRALANVIANDLSFWVASQPASSWVSRPHHLLGHWFPSIARWRGGDLRELPLTSARRGWSTWCVDGLMASSSTHSSSGLSVLISSRRPVARDRLVPRRCNRPYRGGRPHDQGEEPHPSRVWPRRGAQQRGSFSPKAGAAAAPRVGFRPAPYVRMHNSRKG